MMPSKEAYEPQISQERIDTDSTSTQHFVLDIMFIEMLSRKIIAPPPV